MPSKKNPPASAERLQKILSKAGITSRRKAEEWIKAGRVTVNGKTAEIGMKAVLGKDQITVDGSPIGDSERKIYIKLHKPRGYITALSDDRNRPTVIELITGVSERIYPIGRLDYDSEGVLLLTNDGDLTHALTHPSYQIPRTYHVKVRGTPAQDKIKLLLEGVRLDDGIAKAIHVERIGATKAGHAWLEMILAEGRNREIRRMCEAVGHPVSRLKRIKYAHIHVEDLRPGEFKELSQSDVKELFYATGIKDHSKNALRSRR